MPAVSVVVPTHGGSRRLPATLEALDAAPPPPGGAEIIVVDDGSDEPVPPALAAGRRHPVRILRHEPNRGRAFACNRGIEAARGRVVLVLDDDMSLDPAALAGHGAAHPEGAPPAGVIGRIDPDPDRFRGRFGRFLSAEEARRRERMLAAADDVPFALCLTGHFSAPRDMLLAAGGYDERFDRYGFEDIDLAWRLSRAGVRLRYRDDLAALHRSDHAASFSLHCRRHRDAGRMAVRFAAGRDDPELEAVLRVRRGRPAGRLTAYRAAVAASQWIVRALPPGRTRDGLLAFARWKVAAWERLGMPDRLLHAAYHVVRDMHYAAGIADELARGHRGGHRPERR